MKTKLLVLGLLVALAGCQSSESKKEIADLTARVTANEKAAADAMAAARAVGGTDVMSAAAAAGEASWGGRRRAAAVAPMAAAASRRRAQAADAQTAAAAAGPRSLPGDAIGRDAALLRGLSAAAAAAAPAAAGASVSNAASFIDGSGAAAGDFTCDVVVVVRVVRGVFREQRGLPWILGLRLCIAVFAPSIHHLG